MSNRDFQGMREIDVKMIAFTVSKMTSIYDVKSEREVEDGYIDLAYLPRIGVDVDYYALIDDLLHHQNPIDILQNLRRFLLHFLSYL